MSYITLGSRQVTAAADTTGRNGGNWTAVLSNSVLGIQVPSFELYHMYIQSPQLANATTSAQVLINNNLWDATLIGQLNSWDPSQPAILAPGDEIFVLFNVPTSQQPAPVVTGWFRYQNA